MKNETTACVKHSLRQRVNSYMATLPFDHYIIGVFQGPESTSLQNVSAHRY